MIEIKSIQTKKIYKNIVEQMISLISEGSLHSGDRLPPERTLAELLNVSRASLREALSVMEIMGIVDIRPGEGSFVSNLDVKPFLSLVLPLFLKTEGIENELIELRIVLETSAIKLVVNNMKEIDPMVDELIDIVKKMNIAVADFEESEKLDIQFHKLIYTHSENGIMLKLLQYLDFIWMHTINFGRERIIINQENTEQLLEQHIRICNAIVNRNAEQASIEMEKHLNYVNDHI